MSAFREGAWSQARLLGSQINTVVRERPIVFPDGKYLYFTGSGVSATRLGTGAPNTGGNSVRRAFFPFAYRAP